MIAPYRIMILFAIILFNKISLQGYKYFYWVVLIATLFYANLQSPNFVKSLLGHSQIGGGLIDFILISLLPLSLPVRPFKIGVLSLAIVLLCGYGGEHRQELANAFLAPGAFLFSPLQSVLLLLSAIASRSRTAVAVVAFAIVFRLRSRWLQLFLIFLLFAIILLESLSRYHYFNGFGNYLGFNDFLNVITTDRIVQWRNLPSSPVGVDGAISVIRTVKFHNAFVDFRVITGNWFLSIWWLLLIFEVYQLVSIKILLSFVFIQFFWYNSSVILFGWFFLLNHKNTFGKVSSLKWGPE